MAVAGLLKYGLDILSGTAAPPTSNPTEGADIATLKKFESDLESLSKENWKTVQSSIDKIDTAYKQKYGKSAFSDLYESDWKKVKEQLYHDLTPEQKVAAWYAQYITGKEPDFATAETKAAFFFSELQFKGEDYIFQREHRGDFDNKDNMIGKAFDEARSNWSMVGDTFETIKAISGFDKSFIDPNSVWGKPQDVPHTQENIDKLNAFISADTGGMSSKILNFLKQHPDKFNAATVRQAFENERLFMKMVHERWDESSINKTIREGDPASIFKQLTGDGVGYVEDTVRNTADEFFESDLNPAKPFWEFFKDLWDNAGSYIEYIIIIAVVLGLLWIAGEIKYFSTYLFNYAPTADAATVAILEPLS